MTITQIGLPVISRTILCVTILACLPHAASGQTDPTAKQPTPELSSEPTTAAPSKPNAPPSQPPKKKSTTTPRSEPATFSSPSPSQEEAPASDPNVNGGTPDWLIALIGLAGVLIGWLLSFATEEWRRWRRLKTYHDAIYEELRDVHSAIKTRTGGLEQTLKAYLAGKPDAHAPTTIDSPVFNRWFAETVLKFTESERLALTHIYSQLEGLNWNFGVIRENWEINTEDSTVNKENLRRMIQMTEGAYRNLRTLDVMVQMLLRDKERYDIRSPETEKRLAEVSNETIEALQQWRRESRATGKPSSE